MRQKSYATRRIAVYWVLFLVTASGCGYGKVSQTTYDLAQSLYTISNRKLSDKLELVEQRIESAVENGKVTQRESRWLNAIVEQAKQQNWERAMKSAKRVMEDQVTR